MKGRTFEAFDFLVVAFLNIGYFYRRGAQERVGDYVVASGWEKMRTKGLDIEKYRNEAGFELVARALKVPYPARPAAG